MRPTTYTLSLDGNKIAVDFMRSEDCGYSPGRLVADTPSGETITISKSNRRWVMSMIDSGSQTCRRTGEYKTQGEALRAATVICLNEQMHLESLDC
jgi:hypothetical protein